MSNYKNIITEGVELPPIGKGGLYAVSVVCEEMADREGNKIPTQKFLPVFDTIEEAKRYVEMKGFGEIIGLSPNGL